MNWSSLSFLAWWQALGSVVPGRQRKGALRSRSRRPSWSEWLEAPRVAAPEEHSLKRKQPVTSDTKTLCAGRALT